MEEREGGGPAARQGSRAASGPRSTTWGRHRSPRGAAARRRGADLRGRLSRAAGRATEHRAVQRRRRALPGRARDERGQRAEDGGRALRAVGPRAGEPGPGWRRVKLAARAAALAASDDSTRGRTPAVGERGAAGAGYRLAHPDDLARPARRKSALLRRNIFETDAFKAYARTMFAALERPLPIANEKTGRMDPRRLSLGAQGEGDLAAVP